jgi:nicotinate phosphoribosyltransferase
MQQAILEHFPTVNVRYNFTNRDASRFFSRECIERLKERVNGGKYSICVNQSTQFLIAMASLALSPEERQFLKEKCPYFKPGYLDYLSSYKFKPEQVAIEFQPDETASKDDREMGRLVMHADGSWLETILWEVPLMFALSESYFECDDTDWNYDGQEGEDHRLSLYKLSY